MATTLNPIAAPALAGTHSTTAKGHRTHEEQPLLAAELLGCASERAAASWAPAGWSPSAGRRGPIGAFVGTIPG